MTGDEKRELLERLYAIRAEGLECDECYGGCEFTSRELEDLIFDVERDFLTIPRRAA